MTPGRLKGPLVTPGRLKGGTERIVGEEDGEVQPLFRRSHWIRRTSRLWTFQKYISYEKNLYNMD